MGLFDWLFGKKKSDENVQVHAFVSDKPGKGISHEEAQKLQDEWQAVLATDNVSAKVNAAARMMMARQYEDCIKAYEAIAEQHPDERGDCEGQIGAAYFFLGDYEKAIEYYKNAKANGADEDMMNDNIEEAQEELAKRN